MRMIAEHMNLVFMIFPLPLSLAFWTVSIFLWALFLNLVVDRLASSIIHTLQKDFKLEILELGKSFVLIWHFHTYSLNRIYHIQWDNSERSTQIGCIRNSFCIVQEMSLCHLAPSRHVLLLKAGFVLHKFTLINDLNIIHVIISLGQSYRNIHHSLGKNQWFIWSLSINLVSVNHTLTLEMIRNLLRSEILRAVIGFSPSTWTTSTQ